MAPALTRKTADRETILRHSFPDDELSMPWLTLLLDAYAVIDKGISIAISREKRKQKKRVACADRCDVCCRANTDIPVYPLELAGITWYATEKVSGPLRSILATQLRAQAGPPCPLLIESRCSVYPVRPAACRQYIVLGRPCAEGEDPYHTRREDVLTPIQDFFIQAVTIMLPFYGITNEADRLRAIKKSFIHTKVQNIHSCNWKTLAEKMDSYDRMRGKGAAD